MGAESDAEVVDILLFQEIAIDEIIERINAALPKGVEVLSGETLPRKYPSPSASIENMTYRIELPAEQPGDLSERVTAFLAAEKVIIEKKGKKGIKEYDLRANTFDLWLDDGALWLKIGMVSPLAIAANLLGLDIEAARALRVRKTGVEFKTTPPT